MSTSDRPTVKMAETAAVIRRERRHGKSTAELALCHGLPVGVVTQVIKARTINGASVVLLNNALLSVKTQNAI